MTAAFGSLRLKRAEEMTEEFLFPFEKLEVWKLSVDLADFILGLLETFPQARYFRVIG
jgi:hypothetical protein